MNRTPATKSKRIVFWELGGGHGHVACIGPLAKTLANRGYDVVCLLRDLSKGGSLRRLSGVTTLQAPVMLRRTNQREERPVTYGQMLQNLGFGNVEMLTSLFAAWRDLLLLLQPHAIVCDHSPTAMLAARGLSIPLFSMGTGFCQPPVACPLPPIAFWRESSLEDRRRADAPTLQNINHVLDSVGQAPLNGVGDLFALPTQRLLMTFAPMDHYPDRTDVHYLGTVRPTQEMAPEGTKVEWPSTGGPKLFAYLKPMPALPEFLAWLAGTSFSSIVVADGFDSHLRQFGNSQNIRLVDSPIDLSELRQTCDLAILNGNHGLTSELLLAGKPLLQIPLNLEQMILANRCFEQGMSLSAAPNDPQQIVTQLGVLAQSNKIREAAQAFAAAHPHDPTATAEQIVDQIEGAV